jgi:hypothetical protein
MIWNSDLAMPEGRFGRTMTIGGSSGIMFSLRNSRWLCSYRRVDGARLKKLRGFRLDMEYGISFEFETESGLKINRSKGLSGNGHID